MQREANACRLQANRADMAPHSSGAMMAQLTMLITPAPASTGNLGNLGPDTAMITASR